MPNKLFYDRAVQEVARAIAAARDASAVGHAGLRGRFREVVLNRLFRPFLPGSFSIGTGNIVDWRGDQSDQIDVVIYSRNVLPPLLFDDDGSEGHFPAESCLYAIEVKSVLTATEVSDAIKKAHSVAKLQMTPGLFGPDGAPIPHQTSGICSALFAFDTDLAVGGKHELTRYSENDADAHSQPAIPVICVAGRGYWSFDKGNWAYTDPSPNHDEVIDFVGGLANTLPDGLAMKGRPRLGMHLLADRTLVSMGGYPRGGPFGPAKS